MPLIRRLEQLPLWTDCPIAVPEGVVVRHGEHDGREVVCLQRGDKSVTVLASVFAADKLASLLARL